MIIKNFAIIDSLTIEFQQGLNIITGETGAGKSIVVGALGLLLGARAQSDQIKTGSSDAEVQGFFDIDESPVLEKLGIDSSEGVIVRRIISRNGKGRVYINGVLCNVKNLEEFGRDLVDLHGQHDHQSLLSSERQRDYIDSFGRLQDDLETYKILYEEVQNIQSELGRLREQAKDRAHRIDLLQFQVKEIESASIAPGEISELDEERKILFNSAKLRELCEQSYASLYESEHSVVEAIDTVISHLQTLSEYDRSAEEALELLHSAAPLVSDSAAAIRDLRDRYNADPARLEVVEKRLDTLRGLRKKYGDSEEEILDYLERARKELDELSTSDERVEELSQKLDERKKMLDEKARELSEKRKHASGHIQKLVMDKLKDLALKKAKFSVDLNQRRDDKGDFLYGPKGYDIVEFLFSANEPEPPKSLRKVISGGELSRVMLALKSVFAEVDDTPIMVFDEIDAGIGGKTASSVGSALKSLSSKHQILCITHLAQIASKADAHFSIEKHQREKKIKIGVKLLDKADQTKEIARMLSGEVTPTSLKHSEELLSK